jgi:cytochrome c biogenesis protein CcmG/thiol:disulfide interchange protein DsbE
MMQRTADLSPQQPPSSRRRGRGLLLAPALIFGALVLMFGLALQRGDPSKLPSALIGKPAPAVGLAGVEGLKGDDGLPVPGFNSRDLTDAKVSVVNFWASWCVPCVQEHPLLVRVAAEEGVTLRGINYKDLAANARRFLGRYGNPFAVVGADSDGRAAIEWGVYGMPETFVVNARGVIVYKHVGPLTPETLETKLLPAIRAARDRR